MRRITTVTSFLFAVSVLTSLSYAQKTQTPQPVNVVNTPTVTISNSLLPVSGSVTLNNSSIPVNGSVQVSNLPVDENGNVRTAVAPQAATKYEFKALVFHICVNGSDAGICQAYPEQSGDPILTAMSTSGWELVSVVMAAGGSGGANFGIVYTFRRPQQ